MSFLTFVIIVVSCAGCLAILSMRAMGEETKAAIVDINDEIAATKSKNTLASQSNTGSYSIEEVRERALAMGLHEPYEHQIVYVDVETAQTITQYDRPRDVVKTQFDYAKIFRAIFGGKGSGGAQR